MPTEASSNRVKEEYERFAKEWDVREETRAAAQEAARNARREAEEARTKAKQAAEKAKVEAEKEIDDMLAKLKKELGM